MNTIIEETKRMRKNRMNKIINGGTTDETEDKTKKYVNNLIARIIIAVTVFFIGIIISNTSEVGNTFIKDTVLKDNIAFTKVANIYKKYFGNVVPFGNLIKDEQPVFSEELVYKSMTNYKEGYELEVDNNYLVPVMTSGIVVFIGEKEGYGNTVIIQGVDEVDYWYSNVTNLSCSLYDYVSKGTFLGTANGEKMFLTFKKGTEYLDFDEVKNQV